MYNKGLALDSLILLVHLKFYFLFLFQACTDTSDTLGPPDAKKTKNDFAHPVK